MSKLHKKIGVIGGGQLGLMLLETGLPMQYNLVVMDKAGTPCSELTPYYIEGDIMSFENILKLSDCDVVTYEIENINIEGIKALELKGVNVIPNSSVLAIIQNKIYQKEFYVNNKIPTLPFIVAENNLDWSNAENRLGKYEKYVIKKARGGYDGKGVEIIDSELLNKCSELYLNEAVIIEKWVSIKHEFSIIIAVDKNNNMVHWPVIEMHFNPILNLVDYLYSPSDACDDLLNNCIDIAYRAVSGFNSPGVFAVEIIVDDNNEIFVNEIAPRPHNSGHHTIEANITSQFEQLLRILVELPMGDSSSISPAAMINIIGPDNFSGQFELENLDELLKIKGVFIHLYRKKHTSPGRKLGHISIIDSDINRLFDKIQRVKKNIAIVSSNCMKNKIS